MPMNKQDLCKRIDQILIQDLSFQIGDLKIENRFDRLDEKEHKAKEFSSVVALKLASYIEAMIIFKAQSDEKKRKGYQVFESEFNKTTKPLLFVANEANEIEKKALVVFDEFLYSKRAVKLEELLASLSPLVILKMVKQIDNNSKDLIKKFQKEKEVIFNQTIFFLRSFLHAFLNRKDLNEEDLRVDYDALDSGNLLYKGDTLIVPTFLNAFSLKEYQEVLHEGVELISNTFPTSNITKVAVIYLVKDFYVEAKF